MGSQQLFATSGRAQLAYDITGAANGADVLLIHAGVTDRRSWHHVVAPAGYAAPMRCIRRAQLRTDNV